MPTAVRPLTPRGQMTDIGGRRLRAVCQGPAGAGPTVVMEAGAFGLSADFAVIQERLAERGVRSIAYDRAGMGLSDPGPWPRDALAIATDLEALLEALHEPGPYLVVGHSMAGLFVRLFALRNPGKIAGLVLLDATTAEAMDSPGQKNFVAAFGPMSDAAALGASSGLLAALSPMIGDAIGLGGEAAREKRWAFASAAHNKTAAQEVANWRQSAEQARRAGELNPDWPVVAVTAGPVGRGFVGLGHKASQAQPAHRSRGGYYENVEAAGHANLLGPRFADAVIKAVMHVREAAADSAQ